MGVLTTVYIIGIFNHLLLVQGEDDTTHMWRVILKELWTNSSSKLWNSYIFKLLHKAILRNSEETNTLLHLKILNTQGTILLRKCSTAKTVTDGTSPMFMTYPLRNIDTTERDFCGTHTKPSKIKCTVWDPLNYEIPIIVWQFSIHLRFTLQLVFEHLFFRPFYSLAACIISFVSVREHSNPEGYTFCGEHSFMSFTTASNEANISIVSQKYVLFKVYFSYSVLHNVSHKSLSPVQQKNGDLTMIFCILTQKLQSLKMYQLSVKKYQSIKVVSIFSNISVFDGPSYKSKKIFPNTERGNKKSGVSRLYFSSCVAVCFSLYASLHFLKNSVFQHWYQSHRHFCKDSCNENQIIHILWQTMSGTSLPCCFENCDTI